MMRVYLLLPLDDQELDGSQTPVWFCTQADKLAWFNDGAELVRQDTAYLLALARGVIPCMDRRKTPRIH